MKKKDSGQSLIEVIAALAVMVLVILALIIVTTISIRNATFAKNQTLATKFAQEGIEEVRAYRDQNSWDVFWLTTIGTPEETTEINDIFTKTIKYENKETSFDANDRAEVTVTVSWTDAQEDHQSVLKTYLSPW